jgi:hypothetical protein
MPHYKCEACRVRLEVPRPFAEPLGDPCPECGSLLQPVADLTELVGFRSIEPVAESWLDDDEGRLAAAIALPVPPTYL